MNLQDIKVIKYVRTESKKFNFWVEIKDYSNLSGKRARKNMIKFFEAGLGPLGKKWEYSCYDHGSFVIKFDNEKDLLLFLLKAKNN